ncbi:MAG: UDP-N-acetylglucosamine 4-epimerase [Chlamydiia bacterium]|nr:UDP-N-acetylglucosamine 4-epimerase [Chlamydiia bacterium]MCH9616244.1 UDP-N-acetylglucosamine 4-epimerase [Chlamydiia bacterium]MCH9629770.1 UDP-N-acetylglucosamine 4-epimerase [Chlamydiia bacterium]
MKRIFITGISGFIGFHVALALKGQGFQVSGYDAYTPYYSVELKKRRTARLKEEGIDFTSSLEAPSDVSHILHLAAQPGVRHSISHPQEYGKTNLCLFIDVLELARKHAVPLIFASSSSVYGQGATPPFTEDQNVDQPTNLYAATKRANELMAYSYHHLYGIPITALRFFTVYGPWGRPDMAYYKFAKAILRGETIDLYNGGDMRRDFTYIDDIVNGTIAALKLSAQNEVFNLGNNRSEEIRDLIGYLEEGLGKKASINPLPMQKGELVETLADITKSEKLLGYSPRTTLKEGIAKFTAWIKSEAIIL